MCGVSVLSYSITEQFLLNNERAKNRHFNMLYGLVPKQSRVSFPQVNRPIRALCAASRMGATSVYTEARKMTEETICAFVVSLLI